MSPETIKPETKEWILFEDIFNYLENPVNDGWLTIWKIFDEKDKNQISATVFSTFIKKSFKKESSKKNEWDLLIGSGHDKNIEPLIIYRYFHGIKKEFFDISEKFRLYFNLFQGEDKQFYFIDDSGEEVKVIDYSDNEIKVNIRFLLDYLKNNDLILSIGFDITRLHKLCVKDYELKTMKPEISNENIKFSFYIRDDSTLNSDCKSFSSIFGKLYIHAPKKLSESILEPPKKYEEFIFDIDSKGNNKYFTCDESKLGNFFGKNPNSPQFVKPIFFKKEVLNKYYSAPSKYSVDDGYLSCGRLWGIRIDNNVSENVAVLLGDLGRLPHKEQIYWKSFNIPSGKISEPFFKRNFEAEACSPSNPADYFKERMVLFKRKWKSKFGWDLFKDLEKEDEHYWKTLRVPRNEQKEFDEMVEALVKILIESINSKQIKSCDVQLLKEKNTGGIYHLEEYLKQKHSLSSSQMFEFIRKLQTLRSKGVHLKNEEYTEIYNYFDKGNYSKTFEEILVRAIITLNTIGNKILGKEDGN